MRVIGGAGRRGLGVGTGKCITVKGGTGRCGVCCAGKSQTVLGGTQGCGVWVTGKCIAGSGGIQRSAGPARHWEVRGSGYDAQSWKKLCVAAASWWCWVYGFGVAEFHGDRGRSSVGTGRCGLWGGTKKCRFSKALGSVGEWVRGPIVEEIVRHCGFLVVLGIWVRSC